MKLLASLSLSVFVLFSVSGSALALSGKPASDEAEADTIRLSEPVAQDAISETFGSVLDESLRKVSLVDVATQSKKYVGKPFQVETKIAKVCQKKGCFFIAQQQEHVIRVSFRDYSFFIPTDAGGKTVILTGELIQKELSPAQAEHFKQDLKTDSDAVKAGVVYEIVADSVKIPRAS